MKTKKHRLSKLESFIDAWFEKSEGSYYIAVGMLGVFGTLGAIVGFVELLRLVL